MNLWEPILALSLSIFLTILLFFMVYVMAYIIIKGGFVTYNKIKEIVNKQE